MNKITAILIIVLLHLFLISCTEKSKSTTLKEIEQEGIKIKKSNSSFLIGLKKISESYFLLIFDNDKKMFEVFSFPEMELIRIFNLADISTIKNSYSFLPPNFYLNNLDSLFIVLDHKNVILVNSENKIVNNWNLDSISFSQDLNFVPTEECPLTYKDGLLFVSNSRGSIILNNPQNRKEYFSAVPPEIFIDLINDTLYTATKGFPEIYSDGNNYYDFFPFRCYLNKDTILYSFGIDKFIYIFSPHSKSYLSKIELNSNFYKKPTPFPDNQLQNFNLLNKYFINEFRFKNLYWDEFNELYYRISYLSTDTQSNSNGIIKTNNDWSVSIFNKSFQKIGETFFDSDDFSPLVLLYQGEILILESESENEMILQKFRPTRE